MPIRNDDTFIEKASEPFFQKTITMIEEGG
jgi:hypothetical protein